MTILPVKLGKRSYDILIKPGLLNRLQDELEARNLVGPVFVITSPRIRRLHGRAIELSLKRRDYRPQFILVSEGEKSKSLKMASSLVTKLIQSSADKSALVIAFGGGMIGDLAGFVAAVYKRGVSLIQIPTTLLAQIDSSIGGKVGVNHPLGKNLIGAFYQPSLVVADPNLLQTLPRREWHSGLFEAVKYGVIADLHLFAFLESHMDQTRIRDPVSTIRLIESCAAIKARVVSRDEHESSLRMILNFGHTVGHALETVTNYGHLKHGEAVGWGMLFAVHYAEREGVLGPGAAARVRDLVNALGLKRLPAISSEEILLAMQQDKKRLQDTVRLVLPERIGKVSVHKAGDSRLIMESLKACGIAV